MSGVPLPLKCGNSSLVRHRFSEIFLHSTIVLELPCSVFAIWCIANVTPKQMFSLKILLLLHQFWVTYYSFIINVGSVPVFFFPDIVLYTRGIFDRLKLDINLQVYFLGIAFAGLLFSILGLFSYRHQCVLHDSHPLKMRRTTLAVFSGSLHCLATVYMLPFFLGGLDQKLILGQVQQGYPNPPCDLWDPAILVIFHGVDGIFIYYLLVAIVSSALMFFFVWHSFHSIRRSRSMTSKSTRKRQIGFLYALIFMALIPNFLLIFPIVGLVLGTMHSTAYHSEYGDILVCCLSLHGLVSTVTLVMSHKPYKTTAVAFARKITLRMLFSILCLFAYRHQTVLPDRHLLKLRHSRLVLLCVLIQSMTVIYMPQVSLNWPIRPDALNKLQNAYSNPPCDLWHPHIFVFWMGDVEELLGFGIFMLLCTVVMMFFVVHSFRIIRVYERITSKSTRKRQIGFLYALILMAFIPNFFLFAPIMVFVLSNNGSNAYVPELGDAVVCIVGLNSLVSTITMILSHKPYRNEVLAMGKKALAQQNYIYAMQAFQLSGALIAGLLLLPDNYEYIFENDGYYSVGSDVSDVDWFYVFASVLELIFVVLIVANNLVTCCTFRFKFRTTKKIVQSTTNSVLASQEKQRRESSLDKMTWIVCCVELIYFAYIVYSLVINSTMNKRVFYFFYNILCIIYSTFSAWMLLIVSKPITVQFQQRFSNLGSTRQRSKSISVQGSRPFYRLMFIGILVDMVSAINLFTGQIIPARGWFATFYFANESWLGAIFYTISYGGRCVQGCTATILSFCRVSAICFPVLYRQLNQPKYTYFMQTLQLLGALAAPLLLLPRGYQYTSENGGYYSAFSDNSFRKPFYNFVAVLEVFFVLCIVVNNLVTYLMFRLKFGKGRITKRNSITATQHQAHREKQKRESSLDKMTFIVCCVELVYFAFVVYALQINQTMNKRVFYFLYNILCVIYSTFSAWMLLVFSKPITVQFQQKFSKLSTSRSTRSISISVQGSRDNNK
ncbi:unnamed protein product [Caenorhabditis sp. 36 PRJEB53466]|nr:unnamed protein product [Caenorhabditis sp. 36 PRJEB53466]